MCVCFLWQSTQRRTSSLGKHAASVANDSSAQQVDYCFNTYTHAGEQLPGDRRCSFLLAIGVCVCERRCSQLVVLSVCVCGWTTMLFVSSLVCFLSSLLYYRRRVKFHRVLKGNPRGVGFIGHLAARSHTSLPPVYLPPVLGGRLVFAVGGGSRWRLKEQLRGDNGVPGRDPASF